MKLKYELVIDADRDTVWEAFDSTENLLRWQPTLQRFDHRSGEAGQPGAISELTYEEDGRQVVITETLTERREPDFMAGIYESKHATMLHVNTFEETEDGRTRWTSWCNMNFKGLMKLFSIFMIKSFRQRTEDDMQRFKLMVETDLAVQTP